MRASLTYWSYRIVGALVGRLPPRVAYRIAALAGKLLYTYSPQLRQVLTDNIRHVVGPGVDDSEVQVLVREACVNNAKGHYELFRVARLSDDELRSIVRAEGWHHLEQALEQGRGAILVSAHLGNVDFIIQVPLLHGVPASAPVLRIKPERLFQYTLSLRKSRGLTLIPTDESMFELIRTLRRGEIVMLANDRDVAESGRVIDFFGAPARLPDGPVRVALRTGAPLIPGFVRRLPDDSFRVQILPPLELPRTGNKEADIAAGMEMIVDLMEERIAQHPEQWLVAAPVWLEA